MYNVDTVKEGFEYLGITSFKEREEVVDVLLENIRINKVLEAERAFREAFDNRFEVPVNKEKKFYVTLEKETKAKVAELKQHMRSCALLDDCLVSGEFDGYLEKAKKIRIAIKSYGRDKADVTGAKRFPVDQLIEFRGGFARCIFHDDQKPSMKLYSKTNTVYCFVCNQKWDSIDVYMKLNNVSFGDAIKRLTCS